MKLKLKVAITITVVLIVSLLLTVFVTQDAVKKEFLSQAKVSNTKLVHQCEWFFMSGS